MSPVDDGDDAAVFGNSDVVVVADIVASRTFDIDESHHRNVHLFCHVHVIALYRNLLAA